MSRSKTPIPAPPKMYSVCAIADASSHIGEYEAASLEDAIEQASNDANIGGLCWQCGERWEIGDHEFKAFAKDGSEESAIGVEEIHWRRGRAEAAKEHARMVREWADGLVRKGAFGIVDGDGLNAWDGVERLAQAIEKGGE